MTISVPNDQRVGPVSLDDRYDATEGTVLLTGVQAVVRLILDLARRDRAAGHRIGTLVSGYPGSPLAGLDLELERHRSRLQPLDVYHVPGVNEEAAAATVWGGRLLDYFPHSRYDGVTGVWYGKSPGVDRAGDIFRHGNLAGGSRHSALLALAGDDPVAKSSSLPNASELAFVSLGMPVVAPSSVAEIVSHGLAAVQISRQSGTWVAMKLVTTLCDGFATVDLSAGGRLASVDSMETTGLAGQASGPVATFLPPGNQELERDLMVRRLPAAAALADRYGLNQVSRHGPDDRIGLVTTGRTAADLRQALRDLAITDDDLARLGVRILTAGMPYPLSADLVRDFARGLTRITVIEEKRDLVESQLRAILYGGPDTPLVEGKRDPDGRELFPEYGELDPDRIAVALTERLWPDPAQIPSVASRRLETLTRPRTRDLIVVPPRTPNYCSGCPHSRSTKAVDGEYIAGGIGCHGMAPSMSQPERQAAFLVPMGAEGAPWVGASRFADLDHIFQNVGDGTFFHSASQSLRQAVAAGTNLTYKLLYNGHVAMTGGQPAAGDRGVAALTRYLAAEGVRRTIVLTEDPARYRRARGEHKLASNASLYHRDRYPDAVRELAGQRGVTVLLFDQQCAAEKRRWRKRGRLPAPTKLVHINEDVCEGCGDCGAKSNCMSVQPVATELGRKTQINQATCNADYSCLDGDCPSFLTIYPRGAVPSRPAAPPQLAADSAPQPPRRELPDPYRIYLPGIGGTGVVTTNQVLAYAALMEGRQVNGLDQTGLAQKGGAVLSGLVIGPASGNRVGVGQVDLVIALDLQTAASPANRSRYHPQRTVVVGDLARQPVADEIRDVTARMPANTTLRALIDRDTRKADNQWLAAGPLVRDAFGDETKVNAYLLGVAYQHGYLPISAAAIEAAYELNGVDQQRTIQAFRYGRLSVHDPASASRALAGASESPAAPPAVDPAQWSGTVAAAVPPPLRSLVADRCRRLADYQNERYARTFLAALTPVVEAETAAGGETWALTEAVCRNLYKLMAYKDEYEVARLLTDPVTEQDLRRRYPGARIKYNLHPPLLRQWGMTRKLELGPWLRPSLRLLATGKRLRSTPFDPFGRTAVRRLERDLVDWYRGVVEALTAGLTKDNHPLAVRIANLPAEITGYEELKVERADRARELAGALLRDYTTAGPA